MRKSILQKIALFILLSFYLLDSLTAQVVYWKKICAGRNHAAAIKSDGSLWTWGFNVNGQLGDGTNVDKAVPTLISAGTSWLEVACGSSQTFAIKSDGTLWAWGNNSQSTLSIGSPPYQYETPTQISTDNDWRSVSSGYYCTFAIKTDGSLWAWGRNDKGQLGNGTTTIVTNPQKIGNGSWKMVEISGETSVGIMTNGTLWVWGDNSYGQFGDGTYDDSHIPKQITSSTNWAKVVSSGNHTLALKTDGTIWTCGRNHIGQLGNGTTTDNINITQIGSDTDWNDIAASSGFSLAKKNNKSLWSWGYNLNGQLGDGTNIQKNTPVRVGISNNWLDIKSGDSYAIGLQLNGSLWTWGSNENGKLGDGTVIDKNVPTLICTPTHQTIIKTAIDSFFWQSTGLVYRFSGTYFANYINDIGCYEQDTLILTITPSVSGCWKQVSSANTAQTFAIKSDGSIWGWGNNSDGQLGIGNKISKILPAKIGGTNDWKQVSAGSGFSMAIKTDGTLWGWGLNSGGQLGDGTNTDRLSPVKIGNDTDWKIVSAGEGHALALKNDGTLWGWGSNAFNQLGDGTFTDKNAPVKIGIATNWKSVCAGYLYSMGIKDDGTLWGWGFNGVGQLGDGTAINKNIPTQIGSVNNWKIVSLGFQHTLAIRENGTLWGWGDNWAGQLGNSSTSPSNIPVQIGSSANWYSVDCRGDHSAGIKYDGTLWSWGHNFYGQAGLGNNWYIYSPTQVGSSQSWKQVSTGAYTFLSIASNGSLWAAGSNSEGQLGDGTTDLQKTLVSINCPFSICSATSSVKTVNSCGSYYWTEKNLWYYTNNNSDTIKLINVFGCDSIITLNLTINYPTSSSDTTNLCSNQFPYSWNGLTINNAGTYNVHLTNAVGCDSSATLTVIVGNAVTPVVTINGASSICSNQSVTYTAIATDGGASPNYQWKKNGINAGTGSSITFNAGSIANNDVISCVLTANNACQTTAVANSNNITVTVIPNPVAASITSQYGNNTTAYTNCNAGVVVSLYPSVGGGVWSSSNSNIVSVVNAGSTTSTANATSSNNGIATLSYKLTTPNSNCSTVSAVLVTVAKQDIPSIITGTSSLCVGSSATYTTSATGGVWSTQGRATINQSGVASGSSAGTTNIVYTITNAPGCSASRTLPITVYAQPAIPSIAFATGTTGITGTGGYCTNRTFTLVGSPVGGAWSKTGAISITSGGVVTTTSLTGAASATYTITNTNGCSNSRTISAAIVACSPRGVNASIANSNEQWVIYPNPAHNVINLNVKTLVGKGSIVLTDLYGKQLKQQPLSLGTNTIDVSHFAKGMYLVSIITEQGKQTEKVVVE